MKFLALDCATLTGWATARGVCGFWELVESGVERFDLRRGESPGLRFLRFRSWLYEVGDLFRPELVLFEQAHHRGGPATELAVGMTTRVLEFAADRKLEHAAVHTATLKKHATGSGRAEKGAMIAAARKRWGVEPRDDNEADALMLLAYGVDVYGRGPARRAV